MFNKKCLFVTAALIFTSIVGGPAAHAQNPPCYTLASLQGTWAGVATYGANVAEAFGHRVIDANGNFTGAFVLNGPTAGSTTGARTVSSGTQEGVYAVNCDGSGTVTRTVVSSLGITTTQVDDFDITEAYVQPGNLLDPQPQFIATAMVDATRTPSTLVAGGIFITRVIHRVPDLGPTQ
jgi:hypothetical protein